MLILGTEEIGTIQDSLPQGQAALFRLDSRNDGIINTVSLYVEKSTAASEIQVGVYQDQNNVPGKLLFSTSIHNPQAEFWNPVSISPRLLRRFKIYWCAILGVDGKLAFRMERTKKFDSPIRFLSTQTDLTDIPPIWTSDKGFLSNNICISFY